MSAVIGILYTPALNQGAGIGRYTRHLVQTLLALPESRRYRFVLWAHGGSPSPRPWPSHVQWKAHRLSELTFTRLWDRLRIPLPAEWFVGDIDVFHSPNFTLPPLRRAIGVVTVHDLSFLRVPECADPGLRAFLADAVPAAVKRAHHVLADSENTRRDLIELLDAPPDKITVVPAGVDPTFCRVKDEARLQDVRVRYSLPERFILSVGRLEPRKNFPRLIAAYALLRERLDPPHHLVIAGGRGWLDDEILAAPERYGVEDWVHFPGFVADEDLPALYSLADLFAFPSLYEGFGIPPLEAMACEVPTIVADNSSLPEVAGDAALLVPATDVDALAAALERGLTDAEWRSGAIRAGRRQAERYTWEAAARSLLRAYESALERGR